MPRRCPKLVATVARLTDPTWSAAPPGLREKVLGQESRAPDVAAGEQRLAEIASVLTAPDAELHREEAAGGGTLAVAVSRQQGKAVATMTGMPEPQAGRCYQFWRMRDGNPDPAGVLPDGRTDGPQLIDDVRESQAIAVTQEPCAGSQTPTMAPLAAVTIA